MSAESELSLFRWQAGSHYQSSSWISQADQDRALSDLLGAIAIVHQAAIRPVVCIDLDLTTLLAPAKSVDVLRRLAPIAASLPVAPVRAAAQETLASMWRGDLPALLPGYTSTAIAAYGAYAAACLEVRCGVPLAEDRDPCEAWIAASVHGLLRNGYWDRDVARDAFSPGFGDFASRLVAAGATIVFLSNRDPSLRMVSLQSLSGLLAGAAPTFAFFGPGGSAFDASSKAVAVQAIESGVVAGVHFGRAVDGQTVFDPASQGELVGEPQAIVAVIDDRAENRLQILAAASRSAALLAAAGLPPPCEIACAAPGFCPEVKIVSSAQAIGSFTIGEP
jgi:hypothetical protein